jgi:hypothetical protein
MEWEIVNLPKGRGENLGVKTGGAVGSRTNYSQNGTNGTPKKESAKLSELWI